MKGKLWKQRLWLLCFCTEVSTAFLLAVIFLLFDDIMVAIEHIEAVFLIKQGEHPKYIAVYFNDSFHIPVFPKFISVPQFNIGKASLVIVF